MRVIFAPLPQSLTTTVLVLTETGSKYETKRINGVSHFLEHLCFKGTQKRRGPKAISEELDGLGASYNAFTGHEYTGYYAKTEARHVSKALDIVADIYINPTFPAEEIEKERGVIIGEIEMYEDNPQRDVWDVFTDLLYGNQPAGWNIAGSRETIKKMKRSDIVSYHEKHYVASGTILIVAGRFDEEAAVRDIHESFKGVRKTKKHGKRPVRESQRKPELSFKQKKTSQTHLVLGFRTFDVYDKRNPALAVLAGILGGGMSSRLFSRIRDQMGAGYYVGAENEALTDHGHLGIFTGVENNRFAEVLHAILDEVRRVRDEKIEEAEIQKVKNYLTGNLLSGLETSNSLAMFYGGAAALRAPIKTPEEKAEEIRNVTMSDLKKVANEIFQNDRMNLAAIGPRKETRGTTRLLHL